jgi:RNA polymerase sigma-70 factor (ECF subfamily)
VDFRFAELTDAELVARALSDSEPSAFGVLVSRYQSRVRNWLRQLSGDESLADDLAQDTFLHAWNRLSTLRKPDRFGAWTMKIAYTQYLQGRRKELSMKKIREVLEAQANEIPAYGDTTLDLPHLLASVSSEERAALVLCYAHGYSHSEISELIELPLGTVKSYIARGKLKIQQRFGEDEAK